jgi:hypothetical protein
VVLRVWRVPQEERMVRIWRDWTRRRVVARDGGMFGVVTVGVGFGDDAIRLTAFGSEIRGS